MTTMRAILAAFALGALLPPGAHAQRPAGSFGAGAWYESYSFGSPLEAGAKSVSLLTLPFAARVAVSRRFALDASGAVASGKVTDDAGASSTLSGLTDTRLRAILGIDASGLALSLAVSALLPSGHATFDQAEAAVAGAIASDLLPFRVSSWGSGGGQDVELSALRALEQGSIGIAAGYRMAGTFEPLDGVSSSYQPGSELHLRVGLDRALQDSRSLALQLAYSRYGEDQWDGSGLLHTGQRLLAFGNYTMPAGMAVASVYAGVLFRSGGALSDAVLHSGVLAGVQAPTAETLLLLGSSARLPWRNALLVPAADFRLLRREDGTGQGMLLGLGGTAELPIGQGGARLLPSARIRVGKLLVAEGAESGITGFELGMGVSFGGVR